MGTRMYWHAGGWRIVPGRSAPRKYKPLREARYRSWVARGGPYNAAGGYFKGQGRAR